MVPTAVTLADVDETVVLEVEPGKAIDYSVYGHLGILDRDKLVEKVSETADMDNLKLMEKMKGRMQAVGLHHPRVEVRFRDLKVERDMSIGDRGVPTLLNTALDLLESMTSKIGFKGTPKRAVVQLDGVSGCFLPGRTTLLLGPPGAGKTTLLRTLAGQVKEKGVRIKGEILYNNQAPETFCIERVAAYVDQVDRHETTLSVHETLAFSALCMGVSKKKGDLRYQRLLEKEKEMGVNADKELAELMHRIHVHTKGVTDQIMVEIITQLLGLDPVRDTLIGNALVKGISGGQKKRVTSGEMLVNTFKVLMMDEISTGLDSASTQLIGAILNNIAHFLETTVVVALLQPSPETYELFDDIMLMSEHAIVYHGPREKILPFFKSLNLTCPLGKPHADFLQEITSLKDQGQYWSGSTPYFPLSTTAMVDAFYRSEQGRISLALAKAPWAVSDDDINDEVLPFKQHKYGLTSYQALRACGMRELLLLFRNKPLIIVKLLQVLFMAFIMSTMFKQNTRRGLEDATLIMSVMFQSVVFFFINGFSEIPPLVDSLAVFYKQRNYRFFPAWSYAVSTALVRVPQNILEATCWSIMVYWSVGFHPAAGQFFVFWLLMCLTALMSTTLFRMLATIGRHQTIANGMACITLIVLFNLCGFVLSKPAIPHWWIWAYWANPIAYLMRGLFINELTSSSWDSLHMTMDDGSMDTPTTLGRAALASRGFQSQFWWVWIAVAYIILSTIVFATGQAYFLTVLNEMRPVSSAPELSDEEKKAAADASDGAVVVGREAVDRSIDRSRRGRELAVVQNVQFGVSARPSHVSQVGVHIDDVEANSPRPVISLQRTPSVILFDPLTLSFKDVKYTVPLPGGSNGEELMLLKGITGSFSPGVLTALMGASGAGKTTLMDVLADRKTGGVCQGEVMVNGFPKERNTFARVMGYVEQSDIHNPQATVLEALMFSAQMRLPPGRTKADLDVFITEAMDLVELHPIANKVVGDAGSSGLSTEQRKRLTIAVELVSNPAIVFMDEPTSGLDARAAAIVMRCVRNTVNTGRTVVCTIHQPSMEIFQAFDELLLLKRGGQTIFFGPLGVDQSLLIAHFESIKGGARFEAGANPANWMLEVSSPGAELKLGIDFAQIYNESPLYRSSQLMVEAASVPLTGSVPLHFDTLYGRSWWDQFVLLLYRSLTSYWRNPYYNLARLIITVCAALIYGSMFYKQGRERDSLGGVTNVLGALFSMYIFLGAIDMAMIIPVISADRVIFYRERASGMYYTTAYAAAQLLVEVPYMVVQTISFCGIAYFMMGFYLDAGKFFWFMLFFWQNLAVFNSFAIMCVNLMPSEVLGVVMSDFFLTCWFIFCGFIVQKPVYPWGWVWMYYLTPVSWVLYGGIVTQLGDSFVDRLTNIDGVVQTTSEYVAQYYSYHYEMRGWCVFILMGFISIFSAVSTIALVRLNFSKR